MNSKHMTGLVHEMIIRTGAAAALAVFACGAPVALAQESTPSKPAQPASPTTPAAPEKATPEPKPEAKPDPKAQPAATPVAPAEKVSPMVLAHTVKDIDGKDVKLADYKGKVVLIVNVASRCGFTPQYKGLEALYQKHKDAGLVILAFPANNFGSQEPGTNAEIKAFCESNYKVTFPIFEKISVKGEDQHPLFKQLAAQPAPLGGDPGWNFTKFLVDREGNVVARYESRVKPDDAVLATKINELLAK
jgi:glutathione peroxidase